MSRMYAAMLAEHDVTTKGLIIAFVAGCIAALIFCYLLF